MESSDRGDREPLQIGKLYNRIAWLYDVCRPLWATPDTELKLNSLFAQRIRSSSDVLELALGTGVNIKRLFECADGFKSYLGIDISSAMIERAEKQAGKDTRIELVQADVTDISNLNGSFDFILSTWLLSHLPNPEVTATRALEHLRPGGTGVFLFWSRPERRLVLRVMSWYMRLFQCVPVDAELICQLPLFEAKHCFHGGAQTLVIFHKPTDVNKKGKEIFDHYG